MGIFSNLFAGLLGKKEMRILRKTGTWIGWLYDATTAKDDGDAAVSTEASTSEPRIYIRRDAQQKLGLTNDGEAKMKPASAGCTSQH